MGRMPDFLVIGAAKSGTTSLYFYLQQHPKIFMPFMKEPFFFAFEGLDPYQYHFEGKMRSNFKAIVDLEHYQTLFENAPKESLAGEASTLYLYDKNAAERIKYHIPDVKMIVLLRNPVDRAYSHFRHFVRDGFEPESDFTTVIKSEKKRMEENWFPSYYYLDAGFYSIQLKRYFDLFPKNQFKIFLYEDLLDAEQMVREIFEFLGLDTNIRLDTGAKHNRSGLLRFPDLYDSVRNSSRVKPFIRKLIPIKIWSRLREFWEKALIKPIDGLDDKVRPELQKIYREDILELQELIDRDLSRWLE